MLDSKESLWYFLGNSDAVCITTNGYVKKDGTAVMGKGIALQAVEQWPEVSRILGDLIRRKGNRVHILEGIPNYLEKAKLVSFPVKPKSIVYNGENLAKSINWGKFKIGQSLPGWMAKGDIRLIEKSCKQLLELTDKNKWEKVVLPKPGCGAGELTWNVVEEILEEYFDNRFIISYLER